MVNDGIDNFGDSMGDPRSADSGSEVFECLGRSKNEVLTFFYAFVFCQTGLMSKAFVLVSVGCVATATAARSKRPRQLHPALRQLTGHPNQSAGAARWLRAL